MGRGLASGALGSAPGAALMGAWPFRSPGLPLLPGKRRAGPEDLEGCRQLVARRGGDLDFPALRSAGGRRQTLGALPAAGLSPPNPVYSTAGETGKYKLVRLGAPLPEFLSWGVQWLDHP